MTGSLAFNIVSQRNPSSAETSGLSVKGDLDVQKCSQSLQTNKTLLVHVEFMKAAVGRPIEGTQEMFEKDYVQEVC